MGIIYAALGADALACTALDILAAHPSTKEVLRLAKGFQAPRGSIALMTMPKERVRWYVRAMLVQKDEEFAPTPESAWFYPATMLVGVRLPTSPKEPFRALANALHRLPGFVERVERHRRAAA